MSYLHCGQFSQVLALQIKQRVCQRKLKKKAACWGNKLLGNVLRQKLSNVVPVSDCMVGSGLFRGRLLYLVLFACFVKHCFDLHRAHQLNQILQFNFTQRTQHTCRNQSRITSLFSNRRGYDTSHSCNIKTVLSIPCTKELSVMHVIKYRLNVLCKGTNYL